MERSNFLRLGRSSTVQERTNVLNRLKLMSSKGKAIEKCKEELEFLQQQLLETSPLRAFTFEELSAATQGFKRCLVLGEGGFGKVYEGYLIDHSAASTHPENAASKYQHVAVKRLRQGGQQVINRDIKPSNILVDHNFVAKLSDFGLAHMGPESDSSHVTTKVLGTLEYAAPEYIQTGELTLQSDIWSFGVVLLELLSGRRALDIRRPRNEWKLLDWARPLLYQSSINSLIDPQLGDRYSAEEAKVVLNLVQQCLHKNRTNRPTMKEISQILSSLRESENKDGNAKASTSFIETPETSSRLPLLKE